ncbi:hypothetical protein NKH73_14010 [Mesorhizobium sp. M0938]|uniref:hypothetical protein n=1 Tax=unclassified Mesorhizobium TaxID=325217 RepID=UPI0033365D12
MNETLSSAFWYMNQGWVGVTVGICGILYAVYQTMRRTHAAPCFQYTNQRFIEGSDGAIPGKVEVLFDGTAVDRLTLTQIVFWNDGPTPLRSQDIGGNTPISFSFGDGSILDVELSAVTRTANNLAAKPSEDRKSASVIFDFLDKDDGATIRIWHTGTKLRPSCSATVIGVPQGVKSLGRLPLQYAMRQRRRQTFLISLLRSPGTVGAATVIMGLAALAGTAFLNDDVFMKLNQLGEKTALTLRTAGAVVGALYLALGTSLLWLNRRRFPKGLQPED